jgi:hypothetical protein
MFLNSSIEITPVEVLTPAPPFFPPKSDSSTYELPDLLLALDPTYDYIYE